MNTKRTALGNLARRLREKERKEDSFRIGYKSKYREVMFCGCNSFFSDVGLKTKEPLKERYTNRERGEIAALAIQFLKKFGDEGSYRSFNNKPVFQCVDLLERIGLKDYNHPWRLVGEIIEKRESIIQEDGGYASWMTESMIEEEKGEKVKLFEELRDYVLKQAGEE